MKTTVLKIDPVKPEKSLISRASRILKAGGLVVFPTETVYGIGADALNEEACSRIFDVKGRPRDNPLVVHVSSVEKAREIVDIPEKYMKVIRRIWPSPITFIAKLKIGLPKVVTAGLSTVTVRMPAHPAALALIKEVGLIAAPSANPSGKPTATNGKQVISYFDGKVDCIIDSGRTFLGIESTIIDLERFELLRPGPFTPEEIEKAFGMKPKISDITRGMAVVDKTLSPGTKYAHYAPHTELYMFDGKVSSLVKVLDLAESLSPFGFIGSEESCNVMSDSFGCSTISLGSKKDIYDIAKNLYDGLIALDSLKVKFGIIESFDEKGIGLAIMNRIRKASSGKAFRNIEEFEKLL